MDPRALAELLRGPSGPVVRRVIVDAQLVKGEAKRLVGVHEPDPWGRPLDRPPGTLRDSIVVRFVTRGRDFVAQIGSEDEIALFHHEGTQPHVIVPVKAPFLVFWQDGEVRYATLVNHPGTQPNRFLINAMAVLRGRY